MLKTDLYNVLAFGCSEELSKAKLDSILNYNYNGNSSLAVAVQHSNYLMCDYLIKIGVDLNWCDRKIGGDPPIKIAADIENIEIFKLLFRAGADIERKGWMDISAMYRIQEFSLCAPQVAKDFIDAMDKVAE